MSDTIRERILQRLLLDFRSIGNCVGITACDNVDGWNAAAHALTPVLDRVCIGIGIDNDNLDAGNNAGVYWFDMDAPLNLNSAGKTIKLEFFVHDKSVLNGFGVFLQDSANGREVGAAVLYYCVEDTSALDDGSNTLTLSIDDDFTEAHELEPEIPLVNREDICSVGLIIGVKEEFWDVGIPIGNIYIDNISVLDARFKIKQFCEVTRYGAVGPQFSAYPALGVSALEAEDEYRVYPAVVEKLRVAVDVWCALSPEDILDRELGKAAADLQVAISSDQQLGGLASYVFIKRLRFSVSKTRTEGVLQAELEIGYTMNFDNPAAQRREDALR
jgi:hypothetical protein